MQRRSLWYASVMSLVLIFCGLYMYEGSRGGLNPMALCSSADFVYLTIPFAKADWDLFPEAEKFLWISPNGNRWTSWGDFESQNCDLIKGSFLFGMIQSQALRQRVLDFLFWAVSRSSENKDVFFVTNFPIRTQGLKAVLNLKKLLRVETKGFAFAEDLKIFSSSEETQGEFFPLILENYWFVTKELGREPSMFQNPVFGKISSEGLVMKAVDALEVPHQIECSLRLPSTCTFRRVQSNGQELGDLQSVDPEFYLGNRFLRNSITKIELIRMAFLCQPSPQEERSLPTLLARSSIQLVSHELQRAIRACPDQFDARLSPVLLEQADRLRFLGSLSRFE